MRADVECVPGAMKVLFYGNQVAGMVALLAVKAAGYDVVEVWQDEGYGIPLAVGATAPALWPDCEADVLLCVHGRQVVPAWVLDRFRFGGINLHPFLGRFPGANPAARAIDAGVTEASVWSHRMTPEVDKGEVLAVARAPMPTSPTVERVYNVLYPLYAQVAVEALSC